MPKPRETLIKPHGGVLIVYHFSESDTLGLYVEDSQHGVTIMLDPEQAKALRKALK